MTKLQQLGGEATLPKSLTRVVSWKTQNQQNKKEQHINLVAPVRTKASTITLDGDASIKPKHLSFLIGGTVKITAAT
ncbi:hypothetical protein [Iningainema tapete]|uniref:hypothetical protein n=1 Tax=Iningainema tapete TaxID=2806730 RepID=UPI001EE28971|nr:hypothetical protein [Iningainema tapete]